MPQHKIKKGGAPNLNNKKQTKARLHKVMSRKARADGELG